MMRVFTQFVRTMPHPTPQPYSRPRALSQLTPARPRVAPAHVALQQRQVQQVRAMSKRTPSDIAKVVGKVTAGSAAFLAGSAVAVGVIIPTVVDVWARAASSMYVWTETMIERTEKRYYNAVGQRRMARERRLEEAQRNTEQTRKN